MISASGPMHFTTVSDTDEVHQIFELQAANLPSALTPDRMARQGFVTVRHARDVLQLMSEAAPGIIAKDGERVVAYALVMPREFASDVPILRPLFRMVDALSWRVYDCVISRVGSSWARSALRRDTGPRHLRRALPRDGRSMGGNMTRPISGQSHGIRVGMERLHPSHGAARDRPFHRTHSPSRFC
jgi:hypothetical protein